MDMHSARCHPYYSHPCAPQYFAAWIAIPVQCAPVAPCPQSYEVVLPRELAVDGTASTKSAFIGGHCDACLTVEYIADPSAGTPAVDVKLDSTGSTATWNATELTGVYHIQEGILTAVPGSKVTFTATNAIARLRWCERVCC